MKKKPRSREKKHVKTCAICDKEFRSAMWWARYCSKPCRTAAQAILTPRVHVDELNRLKRAAGEL